MADDDLASTSSGTKAIDSPGRAHRNNFIASVAPLVRPAIEGCESATDAVFCDFASYSSSEMMGSNNPLASPSMKILGSQIRGFAQMKGTNAIKVRFMKPLIDAYIASKTAGVSKLPPARKVLFEQDSLPKPIASGKTLPPPDLNNADSAKPPPGVEKDDSIPPLSHPLAYSKHVPTPAPNTARVPGYCIFLHEDGATAQFPTFSEARFQFGPYWTNAGYASGQQYMRRFRCDKKSKAGDTCSVSVVLKHETAGPIPYVQVCQNGDHNHRVVPAENEYVESLLNGKRGMPDMIKEFIIKLRSQVAGSSLGGQDISRKVEQHFHQIPCFRPIFETASVRQVLRTKVMNFVKNQKRAENKKNESLASCVAKVVDTHDIKLLIDKHKLVIPDGYEPKIVEDEVHMQALAQLIAGKDGPTNGISAFGQNNEYPHRDLIILPIPTDEEIQDPAILEKIKHFESKRKKNSPTRENTIVFLSLALYQLLIDCRKNEYKVTYSVDAIHGAVNNDHRLVTLGVIVNGKKHSFGRKYSQTLKPLVYCIGPGEVTELIIYMQLAYFKGAFDLFGITMQEPVGGTCIDHSAALMGGLKTFWEKMLQCYPHMYRKFDFSRIRKGNGAYMEKSIDKKYVSEICKQDVHNMHECSSKEQLLKYSELALEEWQAKGETALAETFRKSYLHPDYINWYHTATGIKGNTPQNQSQERLNLDTKGSSSFSGIIELGKSYTNFIYVQMPSLLWTVSSERCTLDIEHKILDFDMAMKAESSRPGESRTASEEISETDEKIDIFQCQKRQCHFVNTIDFKGVPINEARLKTRDECLRGVFSGSFSERTQLIDSTRSLCCVRKEVLQNGSEAYTGSCIDFWKQCSCAHALMFQYPTTAVVMAQRIPRKSKSRFYASNKKKKQKTLDKTTGMDARLPLHAAATEVPNVSQVSILFSDGSKVDLYLHSSVRTDFP